MKAAEVDRRVLESEQRTGAMLGELTQKQARTEEKLDEIMAAVAALTLQNQNLKLKAEEGDGDPGGRPDPGGAKGDWGRSTRYEFPKFDGVGFEGWAMRAEFFFEIAQILANEKVRLAALHLEGKALQWHRGFISLHGEAAYGDWGGYKTALAARFGAHAYEDPLADLRNLRQTGTLQAYMDEFDELYPRTGIREDQALSLFLSGLRDELQMPVRMFNPGRLDRAYSLVKLQDLTVKAMSGSSKGSHGGGSSGSGSYSGSKPLTVTATNLKSAGSSLSYKDTAKPGGGRPKLTSKEIDEKRAKGECFWCSEKFVPGHKCSKRGVFRIAMEEGGCEGPDVEVLHEGSEDECGEEAGDLLLSLHALWGTFGPNVMRLKGSWGHRYLRVLIDTGSTHNFLTSSIAEKVPESLVEIPPKAVEVANGQILHCTHKCPDFKWTMQGMGFSAEVFVLQLESYDLILGVQWLSMLGDIRWNFCNLSMVFVMEGVEYRLHGEQGERTGEQLHCLQFVEGVEEQGNEEKVSRAVLPTKDLPGACHSLVQEELWPELSALLAAFSDIFEEPKGLPPPRAHDHRIVLKEGSEPVNVRPYKYAAHQKDAIEVMIRDMLSSGVIRHSHSSFASPIVLVKKKDATWRLYVDYRALNAVTVKDKYPIPVIEELLDELGAACWFSKIDLRSGYWQVRMAPEDISKTAFKSHTGHYEFLVMPFGLTNAPATFQSLMNTVFADHLRKFVLVFFDDILVFSNSKADHEVHLEVVLTLMREHSLLAKRSKCSFGCSSVEYLGHVISAEGVATDGGKIEAVRNWPQPKSIKQVRSFLGLTGYYRRFVQGYGIISRPLVEVTRGAVFVWTAEAQRAFEELKMAMTSAPVLALPDFSRDFVVETDASGIGIGAVLMQGGHPIAFISKALSVKHRALSVYEKELLAILLAVKKWCHYLQCRKFIIVTDHQSLRYLLEQRLTTPTQQAWMTKLMQFDYEIKYRKGTDNTAADALSRIPAPTLYALTSLVMPLELMTKIKASWATDPLIQKILKEKGEDSASHPKFSWEKGELRRKGRLVIGNDLFLRAQLLALFHASALGGHSGSLVTYKRASAVVYWPNLSREVREFVRVCVVCQQYKAGSSPPAGLLQPLPLPASIFTDLTMDFVEALPTSLGKNAIFVVVDRLSKYAHFMALSHPFTARQVADVFMNGVFKLHGMPSRIVSDRGATFMDTFWKEFFALLGVDLLYSTAYHPETDGQSEVVNRCLQSYLRCSVGEKPHSWAQWLGLAEYWYNTSFHSTIKMTPFEALYGYEPPLHVPYLPGDSRIEAVDIALRDREDMISLLKANLEKAATRMQQQANKHRLDKEYAIGDWVWLKLQKYRQKSIRGKHHKFEPKFFGPYQVLDRIGKVAYRLNLPPTAAIHNVFHVSLLRPASAPTGPIPDLPVVSHINDAVPQAILERKMVKRRNEAVTQWLIHWKGRSPAEASWEYAEVIKERFPWFLEDKEP